ncbi:MAG: hypothetical protein ACP5XB_29960 [Isosphaeraceae bacterium]
MPSMKRNAIPIALGLALATSATVAWAADDVSDLRGDTWTATDALGRTLPGFKEVGPPRPGKTVGIFYFLWLGRSGDLGPFDVSKILAQDPSAMSKPASPLWGPLFSPHHWGESIFGYYLSDDESVLRKHAQMLTDAGVDAVFFDVTNQLTYPKSWKALCRVFDRVKREGNRAPQIGFLCPFGEPRKVVRELWDNLYSKNLYPDLWFRWEGKPLILADPNLLGEDIIQNQHGPSVELHPGHTLGQTFTVGKPFEAVGASLPTWTTRNSAATLTLRRHDPAGEQLATRRFTRLHDNAWAMLEFKQPLPPGTYYLELSQPSGHVGWWASEKEVLSGGRAFVDGSPSAGDRSLRIRPRDVKLDAIKRFFTFRKPQPDYFVGPTGPRQWSWLEVYPQHAFYAQEGVPEQVSVGVAENAVDGKLGVLSHPRSHGRSFHDGREPGPAGQDGSGKNFTEQWKRAFQIDPPFVWVTGWNEWIAGRLDSTFPLAGSGPVTFCDEFNQEYSRDIEPMQGGHGDNYYYQLIANIRRFKGVRPTPSIKPMPIQIDGRFDDWKAVQPEFRDTIGDPVHRDFAGWGKKLHYRNSTGRNDIVAAKLSLDRKSVSFYVRTREDLTPGTGANWMLLYIDADHNPKTGWLGYDLVVNRQRTEEGKASIEKNVGGKYEWSAVGEAAFAVGPREIEVAVPLAALGVSGTLSIVDFKWADNIQQTGEWSDFTLNGDAAPNDRFNYRAVMP